MRTLFDTSICHDAWLQYTATTLFSPPNNNNGVSLVSTFPGLLVSDVISSTFPSWLLPIMKALYWPFADTQRTMGINHASILAIAAASEVSVAASSQQSNKSNNNNNNSSVVSYWAAPLLQAYHPCSGSEDQQLGEWTYNWLEDIVKKYSSSK